jgi:transposase
MQVFEWELLDVCWAETVEKDLEVMNSGKFGRPFLFPDSVIEWGMRYRTASKKNYRMTVGAVNHFLIKGGYAKMSLTQFYDRAQSLAEARMCICDITDARVMGYGRGDTPAKENVDAAADSTGISLNKYGGWLRHFWNKKTDTGWVKIHVVVNADTNEILAYVITDESCGDTSCIERLMELVEDAGHGVSRLFGDASYDKIALWKMYEGRGIDYCVNIKSSQLTVHTDRRVKSSGCPKRAAHMRMIKEAGAEEWKRSIDYGRRWKVECTFSDMKRMFGDIMRSRERHRMAAELYWIINCHNRYKSIRNAVKEGCLCSV